MEKKIMILVIALMSMMSFTAQAQVQVSRDKDTVVVDGQIASYSDVQAIYNNVIKPVGFTNGITYSAGGGWGSFGSNSYAYRNIRDINKEINQAKLSEIYSSNTVMLIVSSVAMIGGILVFSFVDYESPSALTQIGIGSVIAIGATIPFGISYLRLSETEKVKTAYDMSY